MQGTGLLLGGWGLGTCAEVGIAHWLVASLRSPTKGVVPAALPLPHPRPNLGSSMAACGSPIPLPLLVAGVTVEVTVCSFVTVALGTLFPRPLLLPLLLEV